MINKFVKTVGLLAVAISVSGCATTKKASQNSVFETPNFYQTNNLTQSSDILLTPLDQAPIAEAPVLATAALEQSPASSVTRSDVNTSFPQVAAAPFGIRVTRVNVIVPEQLVVSEANVYLPQADIVWREDPLGDRRQQVNTILENAILTGANQVEGNREVIMNVRVNTFHAVTEKARNSVGGKHNIIFDYVLLDAATGQQLTEIGKVDASLRALGGRKAYKAVRQGETQKVRISRQVAEEVYGILTNSTQI